MQYKHGQVVRTIDVRNLGTIKRWAMGALARRQFKKTVQTLAVARQRKPLYADGKLVATDEVLFTDDEIAYQLSRYHGGKGLYWNTSLIDIGKGQKYQGQWKVDRDKPTWQGLGTIEFADGVVYQGMTYNGLFHGKGRIT